MATLFMIKVFILSRRQFLHLLTCRLLGFTHDSHQLLITISPEIRNIYFPFRADRRLHALRVPHEAIGNKSSEIQIPLHSLVYRPLTMAISDITPTSFTLTPKLEGLLKHRLAALLQYLVTTNSKTIYFSEAALLADFREALAKEASSPEVVVNTVDPQALFEAFSSTVPLSNYDAYRPFISRFMEAPRYKSKISDLLAPGLPTFVVTSSGTAGGAAKYLLKYRHPLSKLSSTIDGMNAVTPPVKRGGTHCIIFNLRYSEILDVMDDDTDKATVVKKVPLCLGSSVAFRSHYQWGVENDEAIMTTKGTLSPLFES